jgi:putative membrane protein
MWASLSSPVPGDAAIQTSDQHGVHRRREGEVLARLVLHWLVLAIALAVVASLLDSVTVENGVFGLLGASLLFGLVDALVGPVLRLLTLPLTVITLGLFTLVVNAILLFIASGLSNALSVGGFFATVWAALLISIVSTVLGWLLLPRK